jgi:hypothetical protein
VELITGRQLLAGPPWAKLARGWSCRRTGKGLGEKRKRKGMTYGPHKAVKWIVVM